VGEGERRHRGATGKEKERREGWVARTRTNNGETPWTTIEGSSPKKTEFACAEKKIID
jgi:hypothetical protein